MSRPRRKSSFTLVPLALLAIAGCTRKRAVATESPVETAAIARLRAEGKALFLGRAGCNTCHMLGVEGDKERGPNLGVGKGMIEPVAHRAKQRRPKLSPVEYVLESLVDPDAVVVSTYAKSVMKPPEEPPIALKDTELLALAAFLAGEGADTPVTQHAVEQARARIVAFRAQRSQRKATDRAAEVIDKLVWAKADATRGKAALAVLGCASCHEDPVRNQQLGAPPFAQIRARLREAEIARWVIAPPTTKMPSYAATIRPEQLADVAHYVATPP